MYYANNAVYACCRPSHCIILYITQTYLH